MGEHDNNNAATAAAVEETNNAQETETRTTTEQRQSAQAEQNTRGNQAAERTFTQADVDRMIAQRISRERQNMQQQIESARQEGRTEAERLAQMSAEERTRHEQEKAQREAHRREQELARREAEITRRELRAQAIDTLMARDLPR